MLQNETELSSLVLIKLLSLQAQKFLARILLGCKRVTNCLLLNGPEISSEGVRENDFWDCTS